MGYFVYFYYDNKDELIYVGQALDVGNRWRTHAEKWKKEVCKIGVREYPDHAAMDIYEHYYIAKYQPCHNTALLHHGGTQLEIPDSSEMILYTIEEFTNKFLSTGNSEKKERVVFQYDSYDERLKANGINVVYAESVDFFDEKILQMDLDNTWFRWEMMYFSLSGISYRKPRKKEKCSTNGLIERISSKCRQIRRYNLCTQEWAGKYS